MITVEAARPTDLNALVELLGFLFGQEADFTPNTPKQTAGIQALLAAPEIGVILVARTEGRVVGMVTLLYTISTAEGGRVCWLEDLVVHPDVRGQGIGSELLGAAIVAARERKLLRITLLTDRVNSGATRLYTRYGFTGSAMQPLRLLLGE